MSDGVIRNCTFSNIVMTNSTVGIAIHLPDYSTAIPDRGRENTLVENLMFSNIVMDKIYGRPIKITVGQQPETQCAGIRNLFFSNLYSYGLEFPYLLGKPDCKLKNIYFSDCRFVKASDQELPNYQQHGASSWNRVEGVQMVENAENVVFNNTSFSTE